MGKQMQQSFFQKLAEQMLVDTFNEIEIAITNPTRESASYDHTDLIAVSLSMLPKNLQEQYKTADCEAFARIRNKYVPQYQD